MSHSIALTLPFEEFGVPFHQLFDKGVCREETQEAEVSSGGSGVLFSGQIWLSALHFVFVVSRDPLGGERCPMPRWIGVYRHVLYTSVSYWLEENDKN